MVTTALLAFCRIYQKSFKGVCINKSLHFLKIIFQNINAVKKVEAQYFLLVLLET